MTLHERLEAAVRERFALAQAATPGPWSQPYEVVGEPGDDGWWIHNGAAGTDEHAVAVTLLPCNPRAEADARFIAANGPDRIVRDCERDLNLLARHAPRHFPLFGALCEDCSTTEGSAVLRFIEWPCAEICDLADEYQIPVDGA